MCKSFVNMYERKTLVIGLTSALNAESLPASLASHLLRMIQVVILTL